MILGRTLAAVTALIVLVTATSLAVVSAALALFWVLEPLTGRAGAAAVVAGLFALIVAICVVAVMSRGHHHHDHHGHAGEAHTGPTDFAFVDRLIEMGKERPLLSIGAALAAGLIVVRNPALVTAIAAAFMGGAKPKS